METTAEPADGDYWMDLNCIDTTSRLSPPLLVNPAAPAKEVGGILDHIGLPHMDGDVLN